MQKKYDKMLKNMIKMNSKGIRDIKCVVTVFLLMV